MVGSSFVRASARSLGRISCAAILVCLAGCGDDEGVTALHDAYSQLGGSGAGGSTSDTKSSPMGACSVSSSTLQSLALRLPLDGDAESGGGFADVSSSSLSGSGYVSGKLGDGLDLGSQLQLTLDSSISFESSHTICAWIRAESATRTAWVLTRMSSGAWQRLGVTGSDDGTCPGTSGAPAVLTSSGCETASEEIASSSFSFVCWVVQPASESVSVSVDSGTLRQVTVVTSESSSSSTRAQLAIGSGSSSVDGVVDEITIWSKALSQTDITALYASGRGCVPSSSSSTEEE